MVRLHVPDAAPPLVELPEGEAHYVMRVLRLQAGDEVVVFDGRGREWAGRIAALTKRRVSVALVTERRAIAEPTIAVTLAVALLKGDRMDDVVRDATALGVAAVTPMASANVAISDSARSARSVERWTRVAVAAAKQCGRAVVPMVTQPAPLDAVLASAADGLVICCIEPTARARASHAPPPPPQSARALLLTGPEGGWTADEIQRLEAAGAQRLFLGPRTLQASLAPAVALSVLWSHWGWGEEARAR
jgi:16S rRNA (uracil1498-N3)-methyltransferase